MSTLSGLMVALAALVLAFCMAALGVAWDEARHNGEEATQRALAIIIGLGAVIAFILALPT